MIVTCQTCDTKFQLDENKLSPEGSWVRCSKCDEIFQVFPPGAGAPAAAPAEDEFTFDLGQPGKGGRKKAAPAPSLGDLDLSLEDGPAPTASGRGKAFKVIFWLVGGLVILVALAVGGLIIMDRLGLGGRFLEVARTLPLASYILSTGPAAPGAAGEPAAPGQTPPPAATAADLRLSDVRGYWRINENVGRIFVIQGLVENKGGQGRVKTLVQGRLHDDQGQTVRQAEVYAGPSFTPEELKRMTRKEIEARLANPVGPDGQLYQVAPNGWQNFMLVFSDLPGNVTEFTAEVERSEPLPPGTPPGSSPSAASPAAPPANPPAAPPGPAEPPAVGPGTQSAN